MDLSKFQNFPKPPVTPRGVAEQVNENPGPEDAAGMRVAWGPETHEIAPISQYSQVFDCERRVLAVAGVWTKQFIVLPRYYAVYVNANSLVGALVRIQSGQCDVTLPINGYIKFAARSLQVALTVTVAQADISLFALGDD